MRKTKKTIVIDENENFRALKRKGYQSWERYKRIYHSVIYSVVEKLSNETVWIQKGGKLSLTEIRKI